MSIMLLFVNGGGFIIQRHNELRDLEAQMLDLVCHDVEVEPVLQEITGESLARGANTAPDARLDIHARGFRSRQGSTFFDVRVCHPNAESYKDLTPQQIYRQHENEKKRMYASRVVCTTDLPVRSSSAFPHSCQCTYRATLSCRLLYSCWE